METGVGELQIQAQNSEHMSTGYLIDGTKCKIYV